MASTQEAVSVATPDSWLSRLSRLRSAVSSVRSGPSTVRTRSPGPIAFRGDSRKVHRHTMITSEYGDDGGRHRYPGDRPVLSRHHIRHAPLLRADGGQGGDVRSPLQILVQRPSHHVDHVITLQ